MRTCFIPKEDREFFKKLKLTTYADFAGLRGEAVSNPGKPPVYRITLENDAEKRTFYLKTKSGGSYKALLKKIRRGVGLHGDAYIENAQVKRYEQAGIPVMHIAAWGEKYSFGRPIEGFLLATETEGERLDRFVEQCTTTEKEQAFLRYGEIIAQMHNNGISETLRIQDIICANRKHLTLTVIDREHGTPKPKKLSDHDRINGLARIYLKNLSAVDAKNPMLMELQFLLEGYLGQTPGSGVVLDNLETDLHLEIASVTQGKRKFNKHKWVTEHLSI